MKKTIMITFTMLSLTCAAQQKQTNDTTYFLAGKITSFQLLYAAIANPDDVTTNQKKKLLDWLDRGLQAIPADSISTKKKP